MKGRGGSAYHRTTALWRPSATPTGTRQLAPISISRLVNEPSDDAILPPAMLRHHLPVSTIGLLSRTT